MHTLKRSTKIVLILLGVLTLISLFMGDLIILFSILFGMLFIYYLLVLYVTNRLSKTAHKRSIYIVAVLFFMPILWMLIDVEGFFNFMLQGVNLDMRH